MPTPKLHQPVYSTRRVVGSYLILIFILFLHFSPALANGPNRDGLLDLNNVSHVRVLLFDNAQLDRFQFSVYQGAVMIQGSNGVSYRITKNYIPSDFRKTGNQVLYETGSWRHRAKKWTFKSRGNSIIRIDHPTIGTRYYRGDISVRVKGNKLEVINSVKLEDYIGSVIGSEMNFGEVEALKAQAVIARTYTLWKINGLHRRFDLTDDIFDQVYLGELIAQPRYRKAALATRGEILTWHGGLILATYSSTCGGTTSANESIWPGNPIPYLRSVDDGDAGADSPYYRWTYRIDTNRLFNYMSQLKRTHIDRLEIAERSPHGKVTKIFFYRDGHPKPVMKMFGNDFRLMINRKFGDKTVMSTDFTVRRDNGRLIFTGKGMGHGIGLCQWGARGHARRGWDYKKILLHYYTGVKLINYRRLEQARLPLAK